MKKLFILLLLVFGIVYPTYAQQLIQDELTSQADTVEYDISNIESASITITGAPWFGSVAFKVAVTDGATSCDISVTLPPIIKTASFAPSTTSNGTWLFKNEGYTRLCVEATVWSSGTATVTITAGVNSSTVSVSNGGNVSPLGDTITDEITGTNHYHISTGTSTDETEVSAVPGVLVGFDCSNASSTTDAWIKFVDATAANTTPGTTTIFHPFMLPHGGPAGIAFANEPFSTALTYYLVTGKTESDTTAVAANDISCNVRTKAVQR